MRRSPDRRLFLVGPRGAGKTSAGRLAAAAMDVSFVDADERVASRAGRSIAQIFSEQGEPAFRDLERAIMLEILQGPGEIVATGGGCVLAPAVREGLRRAGSALWLDAPAEKLSDRIAGTGRPSLTGTDPAREVASILERRRPLYEQCAARRVDTGSLTLVEVADEIQQFWTDL